MSPHRVGQSVWTNWNQNIKRQQFPNNSVLGMGLAAKVLNQMILFIQKPDIENLHNGIEYIQLNLNLSFLWKQRTDIYRGERKQIGRKTEST